MSQIVSGVQLSQTVRQSIKSEVELLVKKYDKITLAIVQIGNDAGSNSYVKNNTRLCEQVGINVILEKLDEESSTEQVVEIVTRLNGDNSVNGIIIQLPMPRHIDVNKVVDSISVIKDVDCLSSMSNGLFYTNRACHTPNTPTGAMQLIKSTNVAIAGSNAVIIGRSNIVGKPMLQLLLNENATVTICHSRTTNLKEICRNADIIVVAIGKAGFLTADMVKNGAIVIDVGINSVDGKICGDVSFDEVSKVVGFITPVPGGCGPMTVTSLMNNTLKAFKLMNGEL